MAGRKPGAPKTGGRRAGTPNRSTRLIRELAQQYTAEALERLADLMRNAESEQARVAAIRELLDRGHGRPTQPIADEDDGSKAVPTLQVVFVSPDGTTARRKPLPVFPPLFRN